MRSRGARLLGAALLSGAGLLAGCVYYNALYNAERLLAEGEQARRAGRDSLAEARYRDVVRKAAGGFRQEPTGPWAPQALLLLGRARLGLGEEEAAEAAFARAEALAQDAGTRLEARMYRGLALLAAGEVDEGMPLVDGALADLPNGPVAAEGHLRRGSVLLGLGEVGTGWWDLERAAVLDRQLRASAALEGARWAIRWDDTLKAHENLDLLLSYREAGARADTVAAVAGSASRQWGPGVAARLLGAVDTSAWSGTPRGRLRLARAGLLREAGDSAAAEELARRVAGGAGDAAVDARLTLARWRLSAARDADGVREAVRLLMSSARDPRVSPLLAAARRFEGLVDKGLDEPLAWFAAAEEAREVLGAPLVARGLFLAYADAAPDDPWVPKALLAALAVTRDEGDRAWIRGRLEGHATSPYVLAARGEPAPGIEDLEEDLARRLQEIVTP